MLVSALSRAIVTITTAIFPSEYELIHPRKHRDVCPSMCGSGKSNVCTRANVRLKSETYRLYRLIRSRTHKGVGSCPKK